jgi:hypothetical protein
VVLLRKGRLVKVLFSKEELWSVLGTLHDELGHLGIAIVSVWLKARYWMKDIGKLAKEYVKSCHGRQMFSLDRPGYQFDGQSSIGGLFHEWCGDYLGPFPASKDGFKYLAVWIEKLSGFPVAVPVKDCTSVCTVDILRGLFACFGYCDVVTVDNGRNYVSEHFRLFCESHGVRLNLLPACTPEWAGMVENLNRLLRYGLARTVGEDYSEWDKFVPSVLLGLRARVLSRTGVSPYFMLFGVELSWD